MKSKWVIKEAWLLDNDGNKILKLDKGCYVPSPLDDKITTYEGTVHTVRAIPENKTEIMKAIDKIQQSKNERPSCIKMTIEYMESLKASMPKVVGDHKIDTYCGVPIEIDESVDGFKIEYKW